jgi:acetyl esterase
MRAFPRFSARMLAVGGIGIALVLALAACAPSGAQTTQVVPKVENLFADLHSYPSVTVVHNLTYERVDGTALRLNICLPHQAKGIAPAARAAIISIHGGSWAHGSKDDPNWADVCEWLAYSGFVAASVNYELAPEHPFPAAITEIEHAVDWLRQPSQDKRFSIDPNLIGAFGGSAGGNLASLLGTTGSGSTSAGHRVAAVAELSGPANLTRSGAEQRDFSRYVLSYLGCSTYAHCAARAAAASPMTHVDSSDPPFFIGHSTDERIPLVQSTAFVKRLRAAGVAVTFVTVRGHEHSIAMLDRAMRNRIAAFFHAKLVHNPFVVTGQ